MKKILLILSFFIFANSQAQSFEFGMGAGSGSAYIFEHYDSGIDVDYSMPFSSYVDFKYTPAEAHFGLKAKFQYLSTTVTGTDWQEQITNNGVILHSRKLNGEISSLTSSILLEHIKNRENWSFGYNFGFGYTSQNYREEISNHQSQKSNFMSVIVSGILEKTINECFSVRLEPTFLWMDPANTFRGVDNWRIAGEDLTILLQIGFTYRIL